jgi:hypothetical protein
MKCTAAREPRQPGYMSLIFLVWIKTHLSQYFVVWNTKKESCFYCNIIVNGSGAIRVCNTYKIMDYIGNYAKNNGLTIKNNQQYRGQFKEYNSNTLFIPLCLAYL